MEIGLALPQGMHGIDGLAWLPYHRLCADPLTVLTLAGAVTETVRPAGCAPYA